MHHLMKFKSINFPIKWGVIALLLALTGLSHWITPVSGGYVHILHVLLRKSFVLPIVLAAIWYEFKGAVWVVSLISLMYIPYVFFQWSGQFYENVNQMGEVASLWILALLSGFFVKIEKKALHEAADTRAGSLIALVAALDAREHETELHSLRVQAFTLRIADEFELTEQERNVLSHASLLHDIGKIGITDTILLKPGPLDDTEWTIMKQHPGIGYRLLNSVPFLRQSAEIVHCHHEKYNGTGYPQGLKGEEIPLPARIFAVADVFDALTSDRPYHKKISHKEASEMIIDDSGEHFDPCVIKAFVQIPLDEWPLIDHQVLSVQT